MARIGLLIVIVPIFAVAAGFLLSLLLTPLFALLDLIAVPVRENPDLDALVKEYRKPSWTSWTSWTKRLPAASGGVSAVLVVMVFVALLFLPLMLSRAEGPAARPSVATVSPVEQQAIVTMFDGGKLDGRTADR
jgi:hypothetical protein